MKLTEKKRESIIEAAIQEFGKHGFLGAKTTEIAKRACVSSRTLYKHFDSKEVLFDEICRIMIERNSEMPSAEFDPDKPLNGQLVAALESYIAVVTDPETMTISRMVNAEMLRDLERARTFYAGLEAHDDAVVQIIAEAIGAGLLRDVDPVYAANQLLGLVRTFCFWPEFLLGDKQATDGVMDDCVAMFLTYYGIK